MEESMTIVEPLQDGDGLPTDGLYMIFEFNPHNARLTTIGEYYSSSPYNRREAFEAAQAAAEQRTVRGETHQYIVARVVPEGGFRPGGPKTPDDPV